MSPATQDLEQIKHLGGDGVVGGHMHPISTGLERPGSTTKYVTQGQGGAV